MAGREAGFRHTQKTRDKIKGAQLVNRLFAGAMGEVELTPAQVNAAKTLLNKVLPDLQSVEAYIDADVVVKVEKIERVLVDTKNTNS